MPQPPSRSLSAEKPQRTGVGTWVRRHPVAAFYLLAFAISWIGFVPLIAGASGVLFFRSEVWMIALLLPGSGPAVAAAITVRLSGEPGSRSSRLKSAMRWRVGRRWYFVAVFAPASMMLAAPALSRSIWPGQLETAPPLAAAGVLSHALMSLAANPWEEVGWRGFALTRLQRTYTPLTAALIVGILWGLWHIPLFLWAKSPMSAFPFIDWFVGILGMSCILAWLYNSANQSLAVAMVFHISTNVFGALTGIHSHFALAMVTTTAAIGLVCRYGRTLGFDGSPSRGVALHVTL